MPEVRIDDRNVFYTDSGIEHASPIIFIHGFPFSHEMWKEQTALFADTHRVITYDVRGHGKSDLGDGHVMIDLLVDDLFGLMDHLGIQAANIVGLSMGGYIALRGIERDADRYLSLVLCNTKSEADTNEAKLKRAAAIRTIQTDGVQAFAEGFLKTVFSPESFDKRPEAVRKIRKIIEATPPATLCSTLIALAARTDTTESLGTIGVPTLVLVGENDQLTPPTAAKSMANRIPESKLFVLKHAAHLSNLENPEDFNRHLRDFFE
jgi:3-oxoadipate enol-lactonase